MHSDQIKSILLKTCQEYVTRRFQSVQHTISDIQEALASETKSTAGDKHETGRAMLQLEREKAGNQLSEIQKIQEVLTKIDISSSSDKVRLGSLVTTSQSSYFLSISVGELKVNDVPYYAIAANSPIGRLLLGKSIGDSFEFNENNYDIIKII